MSLGGTVWRLQKEVDGLLVENQRLRDCWAEALQNVAARNEEIEQLRAEVERLQRALRFWLPHVPAKGSHEILIRTGDDAMLLTGYDPTAPVELDAEARGWITLNAEPQPGKQKI
jgi:hypothetical protein